MSNHDKQSAEIRVGNIQGHANKKKRAIQKVNGSFPLLIKFFYFDFCKFGNGAGIVFGPVSVVPIKSTVLGSPPALRFQIKRPSEIPCCSDKYLITVFTRSQLSCC